MIAVAGGVGAGLSSDMDIASLITPSALAALGEILIIDVVLAGDNAIVVGSLAAGLPAEQRRKVILFGIIAALLLRIAFALIVSQLLQIVGLVLAGGLLLLWVAWRMARELRSARIEAPKRTEMDSPPAANLPSRSFASAAWSVALADVSMSLDNVLAVAGAARSHPWILSFGLLLSVVLMGIAATGIAKLIERYSWIAWIGLVVVLWVAVKMIWDGAHAVAPLIGTAIAG